MNRKTLMVATAVLATAGVGAFVFRGWWSNTHYPPAATPILGVVNAVLSQGSTWAIVGANPAGAFAILPVGSANGYFRLYLYAPYPTGLIVDIDGSVLPDFANLPKNSNSSTSGYFQVENVNSTYSPARWQLGITPPATKVMSSSFTVNVFDVSLSQFTRERPIKAFRCP